MLLLSYVQITVSTVDFVNEIRYMYHTHLFSCLHVSRSQYRRWTSSMRSDTCITHTCFPACMCPDHSINSKPHCDEIRRMCDTHLCSCLHVSRSHYQRWASLTRSDTCITHTCVPACMCPDHSIDGGPR